MGLVMVFTNVGFVLFAITLGFKDTLALRDVSVTIPQAVVAGDTVALYCRYNLEDEPLYTVKWYKGQSEFYRYLPKELPNTQVFPLPGINVDLSNSSPNKVVLRNVQPGITGKYRCEVSTDSPNFYTSIVNGYMYVVNLPVGQPHIVIEKEAYEVGYTLNGNCTSPSSYPSLNISWIINDKHVNASSVMYAFDPNSNETQRIPKITVSRFELEIDANTFVDGKVRLQCVAKLFDAYQSQTEVILEEERPRPRPSSVLGTRSSSTGLVSQLTGVYLMSALLLRIVSR